MMLDDDVGKALNFFYAVYEELKLIEYFLILNSLKANKGLEEF